MNFLQTALAVSLLVVSAGSSASLTNCGSLSSDYNGSRFNDETSVDSGGVYPVSYQFQSTSQYAGNIQVFISGQPISIVSGSYQVIPSRITSLGVTHGQVGVFLNVQPAAASNFCGTDQNTGCLLTLSLTPSCSALGVVRQLSGDRLKSVGNVDTPTARSLSAQNWTR